MCFRLVKFILFAEVQQQFSRLLEWSPHADEVANESSLTTENYALRKRFVYSVDGLLIFLFLIIKDIHFLDQSSKKFAGG